AARAPTKVAKGNALRLRGTVQFQWHSPETGREMLQRLEGMLENPMDLASVAHMRSFFEASNGWDEWAETTHRYAHRSASGGGHFRIGILSSTTEALLKAVSGDRCEGMRQLEALAAKFYADDASQFGVYAEELIAKLYLLEGDETAAKRIWRSAERARVRS